MRRTPFRFLALALPIVFTSPAGPPPLEHLKIPVGDLVFDAIAAGPADGELVLLLHGFPEAGDAFETVMTALGRAGYRAVAPDQRGYSPGARPADAEAYGMGNLVADAIGIVDALGREDFHLVGHDWGGAVAWVVATRYPGRVRTLTVLSTPHFAALSAARADTSGDQGQRSSYFTEWGAPGAERRFLADGKAYFREVLGALPVDRQRIYLRKLGTPGAMRAALAWYRVFTRPAGAAPTQPSSPPRAATPVRVPTLYVWGSADEAFGRAAAERTATFVAAPYTFVVLEGQGHWLPELAADTVTHLLLTHLQGRPTATPAALDNYRQARAVLDRAVEALGGPKAVRGFRRLSAEYRADGIARGQSRRPGPPYDSLHATGRFVYTQGGPLYHEEEYVNEGGTDRSFHRFLAGDDSWNLWVARDILQPIAPPDRAFLRGWEVLNPEKAFPHSLLAAALGNAASLRYLGHPDGDTTRVAVAFTDSDGVTRTLEMDVRTGTPISAARLGSDPVAGDAVFGVQFANYEPVGGLQVPRRLTFTLNGSTLRNSSLSDIRLEPTVDSARLAPPAGLAMVTHPPRFTPIPVAPGVTMVRLYSGPGNSYNTMLVELADQVVVVEAPLVGAFFPVYQQVAAALAPGKPIRTVITTHHHSDHLGGAPRFLTAGVDVVTTPDAAEVIRRMSAAHHTLLPPAPQAAAVPGRLIAVSDSLLVSDGTTTIRVLQVGPAPHVDQILVAHLPQQRVLYVADLFAIPESHVYPPASPTIRHFAKLVQRFDLGFDHVVPTHGLLGGPADLEAALRR